LWSGSGGKIVVTSKRPQSCQHESANGGKALETPGKTPESAGESDGGKSERFAGEKK
jgi:hypothetical protein